MAKPEEKYNPVKGRRYLVTDQCLFEQEPPKDYNPLDEYRSRHIVQLVDVKSGTIVNLESGSVVEILDAKVNFKMPLPTKKQ